MQVAVRPARSSDFPGKTTRPTKSVLNKGELARRRIDIMPHWEDALKAFLKEIGELGGGEDPMMPERGVTHTV
jgi:dTDP-4-dehydrorhamnose reductase